MKHAIIPLLLLLGFIATAVLLLISTRSDFAWYLALAAGILSSLLGCAALEYWETHNDEAWKRSHHGR
jgi:hypothetical protein